MLDWLFGKVKKEEFEHHKGAVQTALNNVKQDFTGVSKWIKHLNEQDSGIKNDVEKVMEEIATIKNDVEEIKKMLSEQTAMETRPIFKQRQTVQHKQTAVEGVQTAVQTAVQAAFLTRLSISEKAIIGILLQSELKLSYEDLAIMLGKDTATVRGQVNAIKQKCEGLVEEQIEKNGKKRLYIPDKMREILQKRVKVRAKKR